MSYRHSNRQKLRKAVLKRRKKKKRQGERERERKKQVLLFGNNLFFILVTFPVQEQKKVYSFDNKQF